LYKIIKMATTTKWSIDPGHSKIQFKVKHLAIANVTGSFNTVSGHAETEGETFDGAPVFFEIEAGSIDTNNSERDNHLKSDLFLDVAKHPKIVFNGVVEAGGERLAGDLTILGNTRPIVLALEYTGTGVGRFNDTRAGFEVSGKFNRKDFGLNFNLRTDVGNLVVGEEVRITGDIELIRTAVVSKTGNPLADTVVV
jgi:polyisoprenoid-binding protein YceI